MSENITQGKGVRTRVLYVHYGENWLRGSEIVLLDLLKSAKSGHYAPVLWCNSEVLAKKAKCLGIDVILDNFVCLGYWTLPRWNFIQFFKLLAKARKLITDYKISLVHCNNGAPCQWMVPVCKYTATPLLLHLHARYMYRDRLTLLFHGADSVIGVSQSVTALFKQDEFINQRVEVIYNGIEPKRVLSSTPRDLRAELSAKEDDFVILYMGSLISRKRVNVLLYAIEKLTKDYQVKLAIFGSGCEKTKLVHLVAQLNLNNSVKFFPASDEVAEIYSSNADCFISVPAEEVFGLTLAEASLAKLPIITSNIAGINEIYNHQENALLVSPNNSDELVNAIRSLIEIPSLRKKLADNAQKHIKQSFSLEQQFIAFNLAYQSLLHHKSQRNVMATIFLHVKTLFIAFLSKALTKGYKFLTMKFSWGKSHD
ncbi:glycosyltransferase family 4 protein [Colwellia psychrerythraea]|uniref:Glycosyl transferase group 1 n=1 Tax=Colwellia psychrerythraea TaxID=28229 RepID=A0A099K885_COLPS|nr:glycosyltransferase family 4 protein [Colwellia psychrerythraea]KGJ86546.1 glycosyl transferase group 1 [Colwellia psychrerythraea]